MIGIWKALVLFPLKNNGWETQTLSQQPGTYSNPQGNNPTQFFNPRDTHNILACWFLNILFDPLHFPNYSKSNNSLDSFFLKPNLGSGSTTLKVIKAWVFLVMYLNNTFLSCQFCTWFPLVPPLAPRAAWQTP